MFPAITCSVTGVGEVRGERPGLVRSLPLRTRTIVIVGVDIVIVDVHSGQQRASRRAAHRRRDIGMPKLRSFVPDRPQSLRHEVEGSQLYILVVG